MATPPDDDATARAASKAEMALVLRLRARDRAAFAALVEQYHGALVRMARMYVPTAAIAEEVVQDAWMGFVRGLDRFEGRSSLKTWLFRILVNRARTRGSLEARSVPFSATDGEDVGEEAAVSPDRFRPDEMWSQPPARWDDGTPERLLGDKQAVAFLESAIAALPERQRIVLTLRDIEGFEADEVRNILGVSETNQRVLLHRARSKVRTELERFLSASTPGASGG